MPASARRLFPALLLAVSISGFTPGSVRAQTSDLVSGDAFRVCADPANYPMSDKSEDGFENDIAEFLAEKLELPLEYTWFPMGMGFIRKTLQANLCDVVIGFSQGHELVQNSNHYYTSVFTLVAPRDGDLSGVESLSDPALKDQVIGIIAGTPPATHLARKGLIGKSRPYKLMVDRRVESPAVDMLRDISEGEIDAGILWGPIAGPIVKDEYPDLKVIPLINEKTPPQMYYRITMGVRQGEKVWQRRLNSLIRRHQDEINTILSEAGVPLLDDMGGKLLEAEEP